MAFLLKLDDCGLRDIRRKLSQHLTQLITSWLHCFLEYAIFTFKMNAIVSCRKPLISLDLKSSKVINFRLIRSNLVPMVIKIFLRNKLCERHNITKTTCSKQRGLYKLVIVSLNLKGL